MTEAPPSTGAPAALAYLALCEARSRSAREASEQFLANVLEAQRNQPPEKDGTDYKELVNMATRQRDDATARHKSDSDQLLKYDTKVSPERRDASEKISRDEAVGMFRAFAIYARSGAENMITQFADQMLAFTTPQEVCNLHATLLRDCLRNAMDSAKREKQLPEWCAESLEGFI